MKKVVAASVALFAAAPAFASNITLNSTPVPEISALEGTAAIAALAAVVLLAWERSRRAA